VIDTKLIFVEGPPGSGKSTTAQTLAAEITRAGRACRCFVEWDPHHPIAIGDDLNLGAAISTSIAREAGVLRQWQQFAAQAQTQERVTVMESRFWQTSVMLMYAAGHPVAGVLESNRRVVETVRDLKPALIYFTFDDLGALIDRTIRVKEAEWQHGNLPGSWAQHVYDAFLGQKWFVDRGMAGYAGLLAFLQEWAGIAEQLYDALPFSKMKLRNPHQDWASSAQQMRVFLDLDP
jgi:hypothetical protein